MAVVVCPWCQNEIPQEEGAEPEKWCPICDNELSGYRTLTIGLGDDDEVENEDEDEDEDVDGDLVWLEEGGLREKDEAHLQYEESVERLLDEQDTVPECPLCREYMLESGEMTVPVGSFSPRKPVSLGQAVLEAPFKLTVYVCPSCFAVQQTLGEQSRNDIARRLSKSQPVSPTEGQP